MDEDLEAAAPEKMLIKRYRGEGGVPWNTNGFGNKDPGRNRDRSLVKVNHFDAEYPVNLDLEIEFTAPAPRTLQRYLEAVKANLPFNFRYDKSVSAKKAYSAAIVELPKRATAAELIRRALDALPDGWQVTALPGYVILYQEEETYDSARIIWRKQGRLVQRFEGPNRRDDAGEVEETDRDEE
ncbi:hypothetical protein A6A25_04855 [Saccharothrix sp. CB00851]|nr:hypothetical protein A6A25_04855 [Saccharothrix sp. CB00851]